MNEEMTIRKPIFLIGFMGCGKSYLAQRVGKMIALPTYDLDEEIVRAAEMSISDYFSKFGENAFRLLESKTLRQTIQQPPGVWATGGGTPCFSENMAWMNENGLSVYLKTSTEVLFDRLCQERERRPLVASLSDEDLRLFIEQKLAERSTLYSQAHITLDFENYEANAEKILLRCILHYMTSVNE